MESIQKSSVNDTAQYFTFIGTSWSAQTMLGPALQLGHQSASDHAIINEDSRKLHRVVKLEFLSMEPPRAKPYPYTLQDMPWSLDAMMIISSSS